MKKLLLLPCVAVLVSSCSISLGIGTSSGSNKNVEPRKPTTTDVTIERKDEKKKALDFETVNSQKAFYAVLERSAANNSTLIKEVDDGKKVHKSFIKLSDNALFNDEVDKFDTDRNGIVSAEEALGIFSITFKNGVDPYRKRFNRFTATGYGKSNEIAEAALMKDLNDKIKEIALQYSYPVKSLTSSYGNSYSRSGNKISKSFYIEYSFMIHLTLEAGGKILTKGTFGVNELLESVDEREFKTVEEVKMDLKVPDFTIKTPKALVECWSKKQSDFNKSVVRIDKGAILLELTEAEFEALKKLTVVKAKERFF